MLRRVPCTPSVPFRPTKQQLDLLDLLQVEARVARSKCSSVVSKKVLPVRSNWLKAIGKWSASEIVCFICAFLDLVRT